MKIDGKEIANEVLDKLEQEVKILKKQETIPHLAIILVGNDPASVTYVNQKKKKAKLIGAKATVLNFPSSVSQNKLLSTIKQFNNDNNIHCIIVQRPLPKHIDPEEINKATDSKKDIDAFSLDSPFPMPLPQAVLKILDFARCHLDQGGTLTQWLRSKKITIVGKGETGGAPIISMLRKMGIEPTIIDSKTIKPELLTINSDIIVSTVGKSNIVKPNEIKKGVILISVGMHKGQDGKLHADYEEEKIKNIAKFYTPVPGGVGPVNVAMLLKNLVKAAQNQSTLI